MPRSIWREHPKILADWHPTLNGKVNPSTLKRTSRKKYWWRCHNKKCGYNWKATIYARIHLNDKCPKCEDRKIKKFKDDIAEMNKIFDKIKQIQFQVDKYLDNFTDDNSTKISKQRSSVAMRRSFDKIHKLGLSLRKMILSYHKKMTAFNLEINLKKIKNER